MEIYRDIRKSENERSAVLLGDEASELLLGLVDGLLVFLAHGWVTLSHDRRFLLSNKHRLRIKTPRKNIDRNPRNQRLKNESVVTNLKLRREIER